MDARPSRLGQRGVQGQRVRLGHGDDRGHPRAHHLPIPALDHPLHGHIPLAPGDVRGRGEQRPAQVDSQRHRRHPRAATVDPPLTTQDQVGLLALPDAGQNQGCLFGREGRHPLVLDMDELVNAQATVMVQNVLLHRADGRGHHAASPRVPQVHRGFHGPLVQRVGHGRGRERPLPLPVQGQRPVGEDALAYAYADG